MILEDFRTNEGLTYEALATLIGVSSARQAQKYAAGEAMPRAEIVERIRLVTNGAVSPNDLHETRIEWLRSKGKVCHPDTLPESPAAVTDESPAYSSTDEKEAAHA